MTTTRAAILFATGILLLGGLHGLGRPKHEATVDRPTIKPDQPWRGGIMVPEPYDGDSMERFGGRRWLILRTGGRWL